MLYQTLYRVLCRGLTAEGAENAKKETEVWDLALAWQLGAWTLVISASIWPLDHLATGPLDTLFFFCYYFLSMAATSAPKEVVQLVERFERNRDAYVSGGINETQLRREFIDPFFSCLGWDIENKQGYAPAYREVIFEDSWDTHGDSCHCLPFRPQAYPSQQQA